jgi:Tfp pilus assembly protein PilN
MSAEGLALLGGIVMTALGAFASWIRLKDQHDQMRKDLGYLTKELALMKQTLPELKVLEEKIDRLENRNERLLELVQQQREWLLQKGFGNEIDLTPPGGIRRP